MPTKECQTEGCHWLKLQNVYITTFMPRCLRKYVGEVQVEKSKPGVAKVVDIE